MIVKEAKKERGNLKIYQVVNTLFNSNTYIIERQNKDVIIIDPGSSTKEVLIDLLIKNDWKVKFVILTHEHADHCFGVNSLYEFQQFELFCSGFCAINIGDSRQNLSKYLENIASFEVRLPVSIIRDNESINLLGANFKIVETPGHSPGSICVFTESNVFTGDTLLNGVKSPLNFPHSDRLQFVSSIYKLNQLLQPSMVIYPGHGDFYIYNSNHAI